MTDFNHPLFGVVTVELDSNGDVVSAVGSDGSVLTTLFQQFGNYQFAYATPVVAAETTAPAVTAVSSPTSATDSAPATAVVDGVTVIPTAASSNVDPTLYTGPAFNPQGIHDLAVASAAKGYTAISYNGELWATNPESIAQYAANAAAAATPTTAPTTPPSPKGHWEYVLTDTSGDTDPNNPPTAAPTGGNGTWTWVSD